MGIVGGRGGIQTAGANVERRRRRNSLTTTLSRRNLRRCKSSATSRFVFVAILDKGRGESRLAGARGRRGGSREELRVAAAAKANPKAA